MVSMSASAVTLFYDGFEGGTGNWTTSGVSLKSYNTYWGVWSLETDNSDYAIRSQSTVGYTGITLELYNQTQGFDVFPQDYAHVEYSPNGGTNWYNLQSWTTNFGWAYRSYTLPSSCNNNANVKIKLRAQTNSNGDDCWWDEVYIKGTAVPQYTLTTSVTGSGSVTKNPNQSTYTSGTQVTLTAIPTSGWAFSTWSGDASGSTNPYVITMTSNKSVTANFTNTPPAAPTGLGATASSGSVSLNWADNTEGDLASYSVYRSTTSGSGYASIATSVATSSYVDNTVTNETTYYYVVTAVDSGSNESGYSSEVSATPSGSYTLTTAVVGMGHIDNTNPGPYVYLEETTLYAVADSGWEFVNWTGTVASTSNPIDVVFDQSHSITANFQEVYTGPVLGTRVLLIGDSWTNIMWDNLSLRDVFVDAGFSGIYERGTNTAIGGTTASYWAAPANLATITSELNAYPSIDMVHLSMGGNDMLAGQSSGGWYKGMGASAEAALFDTIKGNIETVIQHILNLRPEMKIVICSYDYLNLWDTLNIPANQLLWNNVGQPTPRELNDAFIAMGNHQHELALEYGTSVTYVNNWGLMHFLHGYNSVFEAYRFGVPWGHPNYPWPKSMGANNGDDAIHLNATGYYELSVNLWDKFYKYMIDPAQGPLPEDADDFPPPPPSNYSGLFSDGFENPTFTESNWTLSNTSYALGNTYWGNVSLELDNSDSAVKAVSTAGYENVRVRVNLKTSGYDVFPQDVFYVEYTTNYGSSWTVKESFSSNFDWSFREYLLPATCDNNSQFGIRFRAAADSNGDDAWIDEVVIDATPLPCTLYNLTKRVDGQGSISVNPGPDYGAGYCSGTVVTLTATPYDGWTFTGWSGAVTGTTNPVQVTMNAAKSVTATFKDASNRDGISADQFDWLRAVSFGIDVDALSYNWPAATTAQVQALYAKANEAQTTFETYHMPYGQAADMWYSDYTRTTCNKYETLGDSTAMLGYYIGGLCNKYAVTNDSSLLTKIDACLDTLAMLSQCSGKSGYVVRFAGLTSDPAYQAYYQGYGNGYGTCVAPWSNYTWLDYSSRDTYTGFAFAIGNVWIHVSDSNIRAKAQVIFESVMDRLLADSWNIISPNNKITNWTYGLKTTYTRIAISMNNTKYGPLTNYGSDFWWWEGTAGMDLDDMYYGDYFANVLKTCDMYVCLKLETNQDKINTLTSKLLDCAEADGGKQLNAHLAACYLGATGHYTRNVPKGVLLGTLIDFESGAKWMEAVNNVGNPLYPQKDSTFSTVALMVRDRVGCDYIWQKSPATLAGGYDLPFAFQTFDQFTPYWMGREGGAIPAP
jgi:lysophospholipase L1-like esterase